MRVATPKLYKIYAPMSDAERAQYVSTDEFKSFFENKTACAQCGGECCKTATCAYSANDFDFTNAKEIRRALELSRAVLTVHLHASTATIKIRAKADSTNVVDLAQPCHTSRVLKKKCSQLTPTGCALDYNLRPTHAVLMPTNERGCIVGGNILDRSYDFQQWQQFSRQELLRQLFKEFYHGNKHTIIAEYNSGNNVEATGTNAASLAALLS